MRIGGIGGFDPYRDYTAALEKSMNIPRTDGTADRPEGRSEERKPVPPVQGIENPVLDRLAEPVASPADQVVSLPGRTTSLAEQAESFRINPAVMEALRSVRELTEAPAQSVSVETSGRDSIKAMFSDMEDFSLSSAKPLTSPLRSETPQFDMKRDSILQEYQYFVSPEEEQKNLEQDGIFFQKTY